MCVLSCFSHVRLFATLRTVARQAPLSMGFSRQDYWSGLPCPPPRDVPEPGMEPTSLKSPTLAGRFFTTSASWDHRHEGLFLGSLFWPTGPYAVGKCSLVCAVFWPSFSCIIMSLGPGTLHYPRDKEPREPEQGLSLCVGITFPVSSAMNVPLFVLC